MLRHSLTRLVADFGEEGKRKRLHQHYGRIALPRKRWGKGPSHRTADSNRLISMPVFSQLVSELDDAFLSEKGIPKEEIRWRDERWFRWVCHTCKHTYMKPVSDRTKHGHGCMECLKNIPSVTDPTLRTVPARETLPPLQAKAVGELTDAASRRACVLKCPGCGGSFTRTIRCVTGNVAPGQTPVVQQNVCNSCLWKERVMVSSAEDFDTLRNTCVRD